MRCADSLAPGAEFQEPQVSRGSGDPAASFANAEYRCSFAFGPADRQGAPFMKDESRAGKYRKDTLLAHVGRHPEAHNGACNPPVYHASTILSANMAEWEARRDPSKRFDIVRYGLLGTPTTFALEEAVAAVEGGYRAMLMSSGLAAITAPLQACVKCGDHVLMV